MDQIDRMFVRPDGAPGELGADLMERHGHAMALEAIARLGLKANDEVIEIGFGPGFALEALARVVTQGHLTGVDPSAMMHRRAGVRNAKAIHRLTLVEGLAGALPFARASFDAALAIDNLHFWPDSIVGLSELRRVLRMGAPFLCAFPPPLGGTRAGLTDLFTQADWTDVALTGSAAGFTVIGRNPRDD